MNKKKRIASPKITKADLDHANRAADFWRGQHDHVKGLYNELVSYIDSVLEHSTIVKRLKGQ